MRIDFQKLRHQPWAGWARKLVYRLLVGDSSWPPTFVKPTATSPVPQVGSPDLYVHLPFCRQLCPHCPYNKERYDRQRHELYGRSLLKEIDDYLKSGQAEDVGSLYFGGGTPSATPNLVESVIERLRNRLRSDAEVAVEVHPADASLELLKRLRGAGVNRVSLGIETLRPEGLKKLGRNYRPGQALQALETALELDFDCVDVNLIYGVPGLSPEDSIEDAKLLAETGLHQISAYPLFTFLHTPLGGRVSQGRFPLEDDAMRSKAQKGISRACREAGLERSSVWSYTRPGVRPYSTVTREDYRGFGAGAGSKIGGVFWFNTFSVPEYCAAEATKTALVMRTSPAFRRLHWLYWELYQARVRPQRYTQLFQSDLKRDFRWFLLALKLTGLVRASGSEFELTERGAVIIHRIQMLYSLTYIDRLWKRCQQEAWPSKVVLD